MRKTVKLKRIFVSYSHHDAALVTAIVQVLRTTGADVFRDQDSIPPGAKWRVVIENSIKMSDSLIVFWSNNALESEQVRSECRLAIETGKDVIPVLLDDSALPPDLAEYQYIRFPAVRDLQRFGFPLPLAGMKSVARDILARLCGVAAEDAEG